MTPREESSDAELVGEILAAGRPAADDAYTALFKKYWKVVMLQLQTRLASSRDAEDLAEEAFIRAWKSLDQLENPNAFLGWLLRIARNLATDHLRRRRKETSLDSLGSDTVESAQWRNRGGNRVEDRVEQKEEAELVRIALQRLPERYRTVVSLRYLQGLSNQEMARSLGEPEGTIRNRLFRALGKLRKDLERQYSKVSTRKSVLERKDIPGHGRHAP